MNQKEKETPSNRKSEPGIISMMKFDSAISSFLALLVIKSNFVSGVLSCNPTPRL